MAATGSEVVFCSRQSLADMGNAAAIRIDQLKPCAYEMGQRGSVGLCGECRPPSTTVRHAFSEPPVAGVVVIVTIAAARLCKGLGWPLQNLRSGIVVSVWCK